MPEYNELFRAARLRVESPGSPGRPMTRQELADAINEHVFETTAKRSSVDARHVGKWERNETRWPTARYRRALRAVLNVATDAELGLYPPDRATVESVDRKTFIKATLGASAGALLAHNALTSSSEADLADILAGPTTYYRRMESAVPSDQLVPAVDSHLSLTAHVVREQMPTSSGFRVLSEVAGLSAWLAADRGDTATARQRYTEAISYAKRTHHPLLVSYMTASLGYFAVEAGHARAGLKMIRRASSLLDASTPDAARAWVESLHAAAQAALGDRSEAVAALRLAEVLASRQHGELRWPWVFAFDAAKVARYQASTFSRIGDVRAAKAAYKAAAPTLVAPKPRALAQVDHAHVLAKSGDISGGCALAIEALTTARSYGSERITNRVREFRASLPARTIEATSLDDALSALYERGDE